jgi:23S rRNA (uracil1939-C5)-methyltransferase
VLTPSPDRIPVDCAVAGPCGGCSLRHLPSCAPSRIMLQMPLPASEDWMCLFCPLWVRRK